jgi:predicted CXXCH cytochrome family protein
VNPLASLALPAHGYTEIQFAVRATVDAQWDATYAFRLDLGVPGALSSGAISATMRSLPPDVLPPGAQAGVPVETPVPVHRLTPPAAVTATMAMARLAPNGTQYQLGNQTFTSPHANYTLASDACAACHSTHIAQGPYLERQSAISALCFTCHDGSGAVANIKAEYTSNPVPKPNDPTTSSYYSHPATAPSNHTSDQGQEFAGVLNRHAQCVDCHQPHNSDVTVPVGQVDGWTAGGPIRGASGVAVANGTANTTPTFTWQRTTTLEYQLCFKCHSGYTQLLARDTAHPSRWALDKAVELNPANVSYHPVEAQGKNQTNAMAASLSGLATGKLWIFSTTSTIRCENCHGTSIATNPAVNAQIDNHASANRGILLRNYRDRVLKPASESYLAGDFALCYLCHAEAPMKAIGGSPRADTNFSLHGKHVSGLALIGSGGTDIDVAGAGQGNAVCAECHFRIHGDALAVNGQTPAPGLVNFAPDVQPNDGSTNPSLRGVFQFVPATPTSLGTCTLTCHGKPHDAFIY